MSKKTPSTPPERNPRTHAAHRKEVWWQITLPLILGCLLLGLVITGVIWAAVGSNTQVSRWADISLICLSPLPLFCGLLTLGLLVGITFLATKLLGGLPGFAHRVQEGTASLQRKTLKASNALVTPVLKLRGWAAGARQARKVASQSLKPGQQQK